MRVAAASRLVLLLALVPQSAHGIPGVAVGSPAYGVGWASPMRRVFLRDVPVETDASMRGRIQAFKGETEAIQLVLSPRTTDLRSVHVTVSKLVGHDGTISASAVVVQPVGYVRITSRPKDQPFPLEASYYGWWPDLLLPNFAFDVTKNTTQPVWISVRIPRDCHAGNYSGSVTIRPANAPTLEATLEVTVWDFELPHDWSFRNILSWHHKWAEQLYNHKWTPALQDKFFEFLLDRRINVASMYGNEPYATPERLVMLAKHGQNVLIVAALPADARVMQDDGHALIERLERYVPALRRAGVLDRTIVYGWDERGPEWYGEIRTAAEILRERFDGLPLLMAGVDKSYGLRSSLLGHANLAYCPLMAQYDPQKAARARQNGNRVWWYETNWTIDQHLIRSRLIPWQTFKVKADGFLVWCINRWVANAKPIRNQILTDWNPGLDGVNPNSSALYVYPGTDGPLPSLRLENLRDGIEDYDLLKAAVRAAERMESSGGRVETITALRDAIDLPDEFIKDAVHYSGDPRKVIERRAMLARALVASQKR